MLSRLESLTYEQILIFAIAGAAGGFIHALIHQGCLSLPRIVKLPSGAKALDLGFLLAMCLGSATAILVDHSTVTAFAAAIAGPSVLEGLVKRYSGWAMAKRQVPVDVDAGR